MKNHTNALKSKEGVVKENKWKLNEYKWQFLQNAIFSARSIWKELHFSTTQVVEFLFL